MDPRKADRVRVLLAVHDDVVVGAWSVTGATHESAVPVGKTRPVNRSTFETAEDERLTYLVGGPTPKARQRNPQSTMELRDLPGGEILLDNSELPATDGVVRLGSFTLVVQPDGSAEVRMPSGASLTVRTAA